MYSGRPPPPPAQLPPLPLPGIPSSIHDASTHPISPTTSTPPNGPVPDLGALQSRFFNQFHSPHPHPHHPIHGNHGHGHRGQHGWHPHAHGSEEHARPPAYPTLYDEASPLTFAAVAAAAAPSTRVVISHPSTRVVITHPSTRAVVPSSRSFPPLTKPSKQDPKKKKTDNVDVAAVVTSFGQFKIEELNNDNAENLKPDPAHFFGSASSVSLQQEDNKGNADTDTDTDTDAFKPPPVPLFAAPLSSPLQQDATKDNSEADRAEPVRNAELGHNSELVRDLRRLRLVDSMILHHWQQDQCARRPENARLGPPSASSSSSSSSLEKTLVTRDVQRWLDAHLSLPHAPSFLSVPLDVDFGLVHRHDVAAGLPANEPQSLVRVVMIRNTGAEDVVLDAFVVPSMDGFEVRWEPEVGLERDETAKCRTNKRYVPAGGEARLSIRVDDRRDVGVVTATLVFVTRAPVYLARTALKATIVPPPDPLFELNIGAPRFVPRWMREVWDQHVSIIYPSVPPAKVDCLESVRAEAALLLGVGEDDEEARGVERMVEAMTMLPEMEPIEPDVVTFSSTMLPLTPPTYTLRHTLLLRLEYGQHLRDSFSHDLHDVPLWTYLNTPGMNMYEVSVPGLAEGAPYLVRGDEVRIRQIVRASQAITGVEYGAHVWHVDRRKNIVVIRVFDGARKFRNEGEKPEEGAEAEAEAEGDRFCIRFVVSDKLWRECARAVVVGRRFGEDEDVDEDEEGKVSVSRDTEWETYRPFLFPDPQDGVALSAEEASRLPRAAPGFEFEDRELNWEQRKAVERIVAGDYGGVPFVVSGPPGTGKTKTLVESILQILRQSSHASTAHILVAAPSNSACDTLARRLLSHLPATDLLRLNSPARTVAEVPAEMLPYCYSHPSQDGFDIPPLEKLLAYRVVIVTCAAAGILRSVGCDNRGLRTIWRDLMKKGTANTEGSEDDRTPPPHWTHLLIDEASQATEPETLIPLSLLLDPEGPRGNVQFVLCGDHHQLGPIIASPLARSQGLAISLLERLMTTRALYRDHPDDRSHVKRVSAAGTGTRMGSDSVAGPNPALHNIRPCFTNLVRNYRSHRDMLVVPSGLFYHDTLEPFADPRVSHSVIRAGWSGLPNPAVPMVAIHVAGERNDVLAEAARGDGRVGWWNYREAVRVVSVIKSLVWQRESGEGVEVGGQDGDETGRNGREPVVRPQDVGVITPFREQVKRVRAMLRAVGLNTVDVGAVEDYQGQERRVVVVSTVRSRGGTVLHEDRGLGIGLIGFPKRFNVAVTRAQALVVVVGNLDLLVREDPCWREWIGFLSRQGCIGGDAIAEGTGAEGEGRKVGRLERGKVYGDWVGGLERRFWLGNADEMDKSEEKLTIGWEDVENGDDLGEVEEVEEAEVKVDVEGRGREEVDWPDGFESIRSTVNGQ
ncbi:hypothetical protein BC938DRAFT_483436 [Jimgerdemannia flammicorona]|uniref:Uncharacterized protein n=1 Tax=Jimgerdemannia flammicorona TaxID=994334 RepID=A0A433QC56_9FUNG|nr:hypothetical protein BC938DRAFT_483436 [Jimgerdemannia flammicorona]